MRVAKDQIYKGGGTLRCLLFSPLIFSFFCLFFALFIHIFFYNGIFSASIPSASAIDQASATSALTSGTNPASTAVSLDLINGIAIRILDSAGTSEINDLVFNLDASSTGTFSASDFNVEVDTSNRTGYKLYMTSDYTIPASSTYTNALVNLASSDYTIPTLTSSISKSDFSTSANYKNHWGYSLDDATYSPIPAHTIEQCIAGCNGEKDEPVAHDKTPVYVGMNVSLASASGTYRNNLLFSAIANPVPTAYTLSFNLNGGSAPASDPDAFNDMTASEVAAQHSFTIPNLAPEKTGTIFNGWVDPNAESGAKGSSANPYRPGEAITILGNEEYVGSVTLTAQWSAPAAFWTITTMQEMTPEICNSVYTPNNGTGSDITLVDNAYDYYTTYGVSADGTRYVPQRTLYDIRGADGTGTSLNPVTPETSSTNLKTYTIRKLADGNCWMTESLYLPLANNVGVEASYNDGSTFTYTPTSSASIGTNTRQGGESGYTNYYYYNWYAATGEKGTSSTAANVDVDGSICPKGWKLPYNYTVSTTLSWGALTNAYEVTVNGANTNTSTGYLVLQASPLSLPRAGTYDNGSYYGNGHIGEFWSSTAYDTTSAYRLDFHSTYVRPQVYRNKSANGFNVRCVASPLAH